MVTVRRAVQEDRSGIAAVHVASIRGLTQSHYTQEQIYAWSAGKKPEAYPIGEHLMYVAVEGGEVVGFSELRVAGQEVRAVYVSPKVARKGVGSQLLGAVQDEARRRGIAKLTLGASLNAVEFYKKHGFKETPNGLRSTADGAPYKMMEKSLRAASASIQIRAASAADAPGIARVHVGTWRTTYKGIVPDEHLANLSEEKRAAFWGKYVAELPMRSHVFVAVDAAGQVIGFTNGGVNREAGSPFDGEVMAIYLMKEHQGSGVGRRLLQASIDRLAADGFKGMMVWVLVDNPTCGFYERMGGKVVGEKTEAIGGKSLKELAYGWETLNAAPR